jgi:dienelactone hydrolase
MHKWIPGILTFCFSTLLAHPLYPSGVVIDGDPKELYWQKLLPGKLMPTEPGISASLGGEVRAGIAGRYLYLSARLPEPTGRVTARSIGFNPVWEGGGEALSEANPRRFTFGAAEGEDFIRFFIRVYNENDWMLQVGPLGAYSVKWRWTGEREWYSTRREKCDRFLVAARIGDGDWTVEIAIPLDQLGSPPPSYVRLSVERNRAMRPGQAREQWRWPQQEPTGEVATLQDEVQNLPDPVFQPPLLGNRETPIEVGYRAPLPPLDSGWMDAGWRDVPAWGLHRNEASAPLPHFPTEVKLIHDGRTLAVLARCIEPDRVIAQVKEHDGLVLVDDGIERDDSFQVYVSVSGSSYVQYAINPNGAILDAAGHSGNPRSSQPHMEWNSEVQGMARQDRGEWVARLNLPLDAIANVLGESHLVREWRILLVRSRPGRDGEREEMSVLPVTQSATRICPARYRRLELVEASPSQLTQPSTPEQSGSNLAFLPNRVLSAAERADMNLSGMMESYLRGRVLKVLEEEKRAWDSVKSQPDWERYRDSRLNSLRASLGTLPDRCPLETRITTEFRGDGYRRNNIVYQSQPGLWVTANLYLPAEPRDQMPGIIIVHSHHAPKSQFELQDMGIIWARAGCAVLVPDQLGYGERIQNYPWDREAHNSSYTLGIQLQLPGENLTKWRVWDNIRAVDLLLERKDINRNEIIMMGGVAGGGDIAAVAAALDPRIGTVVPFNFGEAQPAQLRSLPEKNQWPLELADPGWGDIESTGVIPRAIIDEFLPWFICASVAPRRFIYSYELGWNVADEPAWSRYRKVFGFYNALSNLADAHGYGLMPGPGEAFNIGPANRRTLYPTFQRWFGIPVPFADTNNSVYENHDSRSSLIDRSPVSELTVLTPSATSELRMRSVQEIAHELGVAEVNAARARLAKMTFAEGRQWLQAKWASKLGEIEPNRHPEAVVRWTKDVQGTRAEAITLTVEPGILIPLFLLRPSARTATRPLVVVGLAEGGKEAFLAERSAQIEALLKAGVAVCLPDVRGTGETAPNQKFDLDGDAILEHIAGIEVMLGDTVLGRRLKDLRSVLAYLESRHDIDCHRMGLWGDSFAPANPPRMLIDEHLQWQVGPDIEQQAQPLGGLLALLGALYEDDVRTIAVNGGLASYLSVLKDNFAYVPADAMVPGVLEVGDIADVAGALAPRPVLLYGLVDGLDRLVPSAVLHSELAPVYQAYRTTAPSALVIQGEQPTLSLAQWFVSNLQR